jgi:hypothetical protein
MNINVMCLEGLVMKLYFTNLKVVIVSYIVQIYENLLLPTTCDIISGYGCKLLVFRDIHMKTNRVLKWVIVIL